MCTMDQANLKTGFTYGGAEANKGIANLPGAMFDNARLLDYNKQVDAYNASLRKAGGGTFQGFGMQGKQEAKRLSETGDFQRFRMDGDGNLYGLVAYQQDKKSSMYPSANANRGDNGRWFRIEGFKFDPTLATGDVAATKPKQGGYLSANAGGPMYTAPAAPPPGGIADDLTGVSAWRDIVLERDTDGSYLGAVKGNSASGVIGYIRQSQDREKKADSINLSNRSGRTKPATSSTNRTLLTR